jgi:hypothetical protein
MNICVILTFARAAENLPPTQPLRTPQSSNNQFVLDETSNQWTKFGEKLIGLILGGQCKASSKAHPNITINTLFYNQSIQAQNTLLINTI